MVLTLLPTTLLTAFAAGETTLQLYYSPGFKADSLRTGKGIMSIRIRDLKSASMFPGNGEAQRNKSITEKYNITVQGPGPGTVEEDVTGKVEIKESSILTVVSWEQNINESGTYTIKVVPKDGYIPPEKYNGFTIEQPASVDLHVVKVNFDAGLGGFGTMEPSNAWVYAAPGQSLSQLTVDDEPTPKVTIKTEQQGKVEFVGWHNTNQESVDGDKVPITCYKLPDEYDEETYTDHEITLYAQYGAKPIKELQLEKDGNNYKAEAGNNEIPLGSIEVGQESEGIKLTVKNTGNQGFKEVYVQQCPNFLTYELSGSEAGVNGVGKQLPVGGNTLTLTLTPNAGLSAGTHSGTLNIRADSVMYIYNLQLTVTKAKVTLSWKNEGDGNHYTGNGSFTKHYGQALTPADILKHVAVNRNSGEVPTVEALGLVADCAAFSKSASVQNDGYTITITATSSEYEVENLATFTTTGQIMVSQSKVVPSTGDPTVTVKVNNPLTDDMLNGVQFVDENTRDDVPGTIEWSSTAAFNEAGSKSRQYTFTPKDNKNYVTYTGTATVNVTEKEAPSLNLVNNSQLSQTYDGSAKHVSFVCTDGDGALTVTYAKKQGESTYDQETPDKPIDAGTYKVTATVAETANYASVSLTVEMTIAPKQITAIATVDSEVYDGDTEVDTSKVHISLHDVLSRDSADVTATVGSATYDSKDAGYKTVTVQLGELTGEKAGNYQLQATEIHASGSISKKEVTLSAKHDAKLAKKYGQGFNFDLSQFDAEGVVDGEILDSTYVSLICEGVKQDAKVGSYDIEVENHDGGNYKAKFDGTPVLTVEQAKVVAVDNSVRATDGRKNGSTDRVTITGAFANANNKEMKVDGELEFDFSNTAAAGGTFPSAPSIEVGWKFTPKDKVNYEDEALTGKVTITLTDKDPVELNISDANLEITYDGSPKDFSKLVKVTPDQPSDIEYQYKIHVDTEEGGHGSSTDTSSGDNYTGWNSNPPTDAALYDVQIVASPIDSELYSETSTVVHMRITKRSPDVKITTAVDEGTTLGEVEATITGLNSSIKVNGTFTWDAGNESVINENETYYWHFDSTDGNYGAANGTTTFTFNPDSRKIVATVYNLPGDDGNYAVVDVKASELKVGEILTFYKTSTCDSPESADVTITNEAETALVIKLDADALSAKAGKIYAKVNKTKFQPTALDYAAEPGGELTDLTLYVNETADTPAGVTDVAYEITDNTIVDVRDGKLTALKTGSTTITVTLTYAHPDKDRHPNDTFTVTKTITVNVKEMSYGGGGGAATSGNQAVTNPDGSKTTTVTNSDGTKTETTTKTDGVVGSTQLGSDGKVTSADVTIPSTAKPDENGVVTVPIEVPAAKDTAEAPEISVKSQSGESTKVEIPVTEFGPGTVAVVVHPDGTEEVVRDCVIGENGVVLNVEGNVTLKIVDNTETFTDVEPVHHWATDAVEFVAARELFNGTGNHQFTPNGDMTRGMLVTVLYRLAYEPESGDGGFADVDTNAYYADAVVWAENAGVVNGYGNGSFGPNENVTREQLVTILYRYAVKKGYLTGHTGSLSGYADVGSVSSYAAEAMCWAVEIGLVKGVDDTHIAPLNNAARAQVATILMRFCEKVVK